MSSESDWFRAVTGEAPPRVRSHCAECDGHDDDLDPHGGTYVKVDNNYPHYEGPGHRWLPVNGKLKSYYLPLNEPRWIAADDATEMRPRDPVVGLAIGDKAWALPWFVMKNHHVANLDLAGRPVLVTFCEACTSAAAWDPVVNGERHTFRLDAVYNGTISPIDLETKSAWTGFTGESYFGPLKGTRLTRFPLVQCTWEQWTTEFPNTLVPDATGERRDGHGARHYPGSPMETSVTKNALRVDDRLDPTTLVLGIGSPTRSRCYPLQELAAIGPVHHDHFEERDIVIFSKPEVWRALAFSRILDGQRLSFAGEGDGFVDAETGSRWNCLGRAVSGPFVGRELEYIFSGVEKFSVWSAFHGDTEIFAQPTTSLPPQVLREAQLEKWEGRWTDVSYTPMWDTRGDDPSLQSALAEGWLRPGMKVLDLGCGRGEMAAWLAAQGCRVMGADISHQVIEQARRSHDGVPGVKFIQLDACARGQQIGPFDAVVDRGCLHVIQAELQDAYARNVRLWSRKGTRVLLLMHCRNAHSVEERTEQVRRLFLPDFELLSVEPIDMTSPGGTKPVPGCVFRLEKR